VFTVTLPKLKLPALIVSWGLGATVLVPLSETTVVPPVEELLPIVSCPLAEPVVVGLNCTRNVSDCVGFRVAGRLPPTIEKPPPEIAAEFTVNGAEPVELIVRVWIVAVLTVTLPKLRLAALAVSCELGAAMAVPFNEITAVPPGRALLFKAICPVTAPVVAGLNTTWSVNDWFGPTVAGRLLPTIEKPEPVIEPRLTVADDEPVELRVNV
jgi:hypothetical protein